MLDIVFGFVPATTGAIVLAGIAASVIAEVILIRRRNRRVAGNGPTSTESD